MYSTSFGAFSVAMRISESFLCLRSVLGALLDVNSGELTSSFAIRFEADVRDYSALGISRSSIDVSITSRYSSLLIISNPSPLGSFWVTVCPSVASSK